MMPNGIPSTTPQKAGENRPDVRTNLHSNVGSRSNPLLRNSPDAAIPSPSGVNSLTTSTKGNNATSSYVPQLETPATPTPQSKQIKDKGKEKASYDYSSEQDEQIGDPVLGPTPQAISFFRENAADALLHMYAVASTPTSSSSGSLSLPQPPRRLAGSRRLQTAKATNRLLQPSIRITRPSNDNTVPNTGDPQIEPIGDFLSRDFAADSVMGTSDEVEIIAPPAPLSGPSGTRLGAPEPVQEALPTPDNPYGLPAFVEYPRPDGGDVPQFDDMAAEQLKAQQELIKALSAQFKRQPDPPVPASADPSVARRGGAYEAPWVDSYQADVNANKELAYAIQRPADSDPSTDTQIHELAQHPVPGPSNVNDGAELSRDLQSIQAQRKKLEETIANTRLHDVALAHEILANDSHLHLRSQGKLDNLPRSRAVPPIVMAAPGPVFAIDIDPSNSLNRDDTMSDIQDVHASSSSLSFVSSSSASSSSTITTPTNTRMSVRRLRHRPRSSMLVGEEHWQTTTLAINGQARGVMTCRKPKGLLQDQEEDEEKAFANFYKDRKGKGKAPVRWYEDNDRFDAPAYSGDAPVRNPHVPKHQSSPLGVHSALSEPSLFRPSLSPRPSWIENKDRDQGADAGSSWDAGIEDNMPSVSRNTMGYNSSAANIWSPLTSAGQELPSFGQLPASEDIRVGMADVRTPAEKQNTVCHNTWGASTSSLYQASGIQGEPSANPLPASEGMEMEGGSPAVSNAAISAILDDLLASVLPVKVETKVKKQPSSSSSHPPDDVSDPTDFDEDDHSYSQQQQVTGVGNNDTANNVDDKTLYGSESKDETAGKNDDGDVEEVPTGPSDQHREGCTVANSFASAHSSLIDRYPYINEDETSSFGRSADIPTFSQPPDNNVRMEEDMDSDIAIRSTERYSADHSMTSVPSDSLDFLPSIERNEITATTAPNDMSFVSMHQHFSVQEQHVDVEIPSFPNAIDDGVDIQMNVETSQRTEGSSLAASWTFGPSAAGDHPQINQQKTSTPKPLTDAFAAPQPVSVTDIDYNAIFSDVHLDVYGGDHEFTEDAPKLDISSLAQNAEPSSVRTKVIIDEAIDHRQPLPSVSSTHPPSNSLPPQGKAASDTACAPVLESESSLETGMNTRSQVHIHEARKVTMVELVDEDELRARRKPKADPGVLLQDQEQPMVPKGPTSSMSTSPQVAPIPVGDASKPEPEIWVNVINTLNPEFISGAAGSCRSSVPEWAPISDSTADPVGETMVKPVPLDTNDIRVAADPGRILLNDERSVPSSSGLTSASKEPSTSSDDPSRPPQAVVPSDAIPKGDCIPNSSSAPKAPSNRPSTPRSNAGSGMTESALQEDGDIFDFDAVHSRYIMVPLSDFIGTEDMDTQLDFPEDRTRLWNGSGMTDQMQEPTLMDTEDEPIPTPNPSPRVPPHTNVESNPRNANTLSNIELANSVPHAAVFEEYRPRFLESLDLFDVELPPCPEPPDDGPALEEDIKPPVDHPAPWEGAAANKPGQAPQPPPAPMFKEAKLQAKGVRIRNPLVDCWASQRPHSGSNTDARPESRERPEPSQSSTSEEESYPMPGAFGFVPLPLAWHFPFWSHLSVIFGNALMELRRELHLMSLR